METIEDVMVLLMMIMAMRKSINVLLSHVQILMPMETVSFLRRNLKAG